MAITKLSHALERAVVDEHGDTLYVRLTPQGLTFRRPFQKQEYLLPYAAAETRAQVLANDGVGMATGKPRRKGGKPVTNVSRGLLTIGK